MHTMRLLRFCCASVALRLVLFRRVYADNGRGEFVYIRNIALQMGTWKVETRMSRVSDELRARAASDRAEAEATTLVNKKAVLLASAMRLDQLAAQAERAEAFTKKRSG